jgi:UDP-N-acetylglucosamine 4,6-dehydratase/5-epimerase
MTDQAVFDAIDGKRVLVTGGTGSFGHHIVTQLLECNPESVHVYSRDEKKQYDMAIAFKGDARLKFHIGDVRSYERTLEIMRGKNIVFNAAALKQVPNCEYAPFEAVQTNVAGPHNVRRAAIECGIETVISISTDKAVKPVNVMGMTKALHERIMLQPSNHETNTRFVCVRYGNVLGSRGSVVPFFCKLIREGLPLKITNPTMTRFQLTLPESVQLVLSATINGRCGDLLVRKMPAANIVDLARAISLGLTGKEQYPTEIVGTRPGEKIHEVLVSEEEMWRADELDQYYRISNWASLEEQQSPQKTEVEEYSSDRTYQMSVREILEMLREDGWVTNHGIGPGEKLDGELRRAA